MSVTNWLQPISIGNPAQAALWRVYKVNPCMTDHDLCSEALCNSNQLAVLLSFAEWGVLSEQHRSGIWSFFWAFWPICILLLWLFSYLFLENLLGTGDTLKTNALPFSLSHLSILSTEGPKRPKTCWRHTWTAHNNILFWSDLVQNGWPGVLLASGP